MPKIYTVLFKEKCNKTDEYHSFMNLNLLLLLLLVLYPKNANVVEKCKTNDVIRDFYDIKRIVLTF